MPRSSRRFGHKSASGPMRRWRGNGRLYPARVKRRLGLAKARAKHDAEGASPAPTSQHPKHRVAQPSGWASTRQKETLVFLEAFLEAFFLIIAAKTIFEVAQ